MKSISNYHFTNPNKILYPEQAITKLDLAKYYHHVHQWMLPYIVKRPLTIVRCPEGWHKKCFYQKHLYETTIKDIYYIQIQEKKSKAPYLYIKNESGLMALVQLGVLEMHAWGCHVDNTEKPDCIIFDLDPSPDIEWKKLIQAAYQVKDNLEKIHLTSFVKTTGGKGLHIVVPIKRQYGWKEIEIFTRTFAQYLVLKKPDLYIATMSKARRKNKIFIDYLRNQRGSTAIVPYSTRAKENAPISTPLDWEELSGHIKSDTFTLKNLTKRLKNLKKDPWEGFFDLKQTIRLPR